MSYRQFSSALNDSIRTRVRDYAALGAMSLSADEHSRLRRREDEGTKEYGDVVSALRRIKAASTDIRFVYTVRKSEDGKVVFVADATETEAELSHLGDVYEGATPLLRKSVDGLEAPVMEESFYTDEWGTFLSAYAPIRTSGGRLDGLLCMDISFESVQHALLNTLLKSLLLMAVSFALIVPVASVLSRHIVLPIKDCVAFTGLLARSDYSQDVPASLRRRGDELGELGSAYVTMAGNTRDLVASIKNQSGALSDIGLELSSNMDETAASINEINANIQSIKRQIINQSASVTETTSTMERITQNIQKLNGHIDLQAASVTQSSAAVEEVLANIASVTDTLAKNAENVDELAAASEEGRSDLAAVSDSIREVAKESEGLLEISEVIQTIASQTNLLSMNAAIEAAHAGDSGRGFSVVADEIRKLAESSGEQAKTVSISLKKIKDAMKRITHATDTVLEQFEAIDARIKMVSEREGGMRDAMKEQSVGSEEVLGAIGRLNDITVQVKSGFDQMMTGSREVIRESVNLGRITEEVSGSMNEMASGAEQIAVAVNRVNDISRNNKDSVAALMAEVSKFKVR
jgi:methyl-accepting chemotaxis protein